MRPSPRGIGAGLTVWVVLLVGLSVGAPLLSGPGTVTEAQAPRPLLQSFSSPTAPGNSVLANRTSFFPAQAWTTLFQEELPPSVSALQAAQVAVHSPSGAAQVQVAVRVTDLADGASFRYLNGTSPPLSGPWFNLTESTPTLLNASAPYQITLNALCSEAAPDCQVGGGSDLPALELWFNRSSTLSVNSTSSVALSNGAVSVAGFLPPGSQSLVHVETALEVSCGCSSWSYTLFANLSRNGSVAPLLSLVRTVSSPNANLPVLRVGWSLDASLADSARYTLNLTVTSWNPSGIVASLGGAPEPSLNFTAVYPQGLSAAPSGQYAPLPVTFQLTGLLAPRGSFQAFFASGNGTGVVETPIGGSATSASLTYEWPGSFAPSVREVQTLGPTLSEVLWDPSSGPVNLSVEPPPAWELGTLPSPAAGPAPLEVSLTGGLAPWGSSWTYTVDWGDGSSAQALTGLNGSAVHRYTVEGRFPLGLTACDVGGYCDRDLSAPTVVTSVLPVIHAALQPVDAGVNETFTPAALGGTNQFVNYTWSFGDGRRAWGNRTLEHRYAHPGVYAVNLTVTDSAGSVGTSQLNLTVEPPLQVVASLHPLSGGAPLLFEGSVRVSGGTSRPAPGLPGSVSNVSETWVLAGEAPASGCVFSALLPSPGLFSGVLFVNDSGGSHESIPFQVSVNASRAPVGWLLPRGNDLQDGLAGGTGPFMAHLQAQARLPPGAILGLVTSGEGPIYAAYPDGALFALDPFNLTLVWARNLSVPGFAFTAGPALADGNLVLGTNDGTLLAFNQSTGVLSWNASVAPPGALLSDPLVVQGDLLILSNQSVSRVNGTTGGLLWQVPNPSGEAASAALEGATLSWFGPSTQYSLAVATGGIAQDYAPLATPGRLAEQAGYLVLANSSGTLLAYPQGGSLAWTASLSGPGGPLAPALEDGLLYAARDGGPLTGLSLENGTVQWYGAGAAAVSTPPTVSGPTVYVGTSVAGSSTLVAEGLHGGLQWSLPLPAPPQGDLAVAQGLLYVHSLDGTLSAVGYPPLALDAQANRTQVAAGQPVGLFASASGGDGSTVSFAWAFSDGGTASGANVSHIFSTPGPAWAEVLATDADGYQGPAVNLSLTVLSPLSVSLAVNATRGASPLEVSLVETPNGGSLRYPTLSLLVQGPLAENLTGPTGSLTLVSAGNYTLLGRVRDSAGDVAISTPISVSVTTPAPSPSTLTVSPGPPGSFTVHWAPYRGPGFSAYRVGYRVDGANTTTWLAPITSSGTSSLPLRGFPLDAQVALYLNTTSLYGSYALSGPVDYVIPLTPPSLNVSSPVGAPGQALLNWSLPPVDHFLDWTLRSVSSEGSASQVLSLNASARSYLAPPAPDLLTTRYQIELTVAGNQSALSAPVPFTPLYVAPVPSLGGDGVKTYVSFGGVSMSGLTAVDVCFAPVPAGAAQCPVIVPGPSAQGTPLSLPGPGEYRVWLKVQASNGFSFNGTSVLYQAYAGAPAAAWYLWTFLSAPLWSWIVLALLALAVLLLARALYRERNTIPPLLDTLLPWESTTPPSEPPAPRRKLPRPAPARVLRPLHVHGTSHPHRHARPHRKPVRDAAPPSVPPRRNGAAASRSEWTRMEEELDRLDEEIRPTAEQDGTPLPRRARAAPEKPEEETPAPAPGKKAPATPPEPPPARKPPRETRAEDDEPTL